MGIELHNTPEKENDDFCPGCGKEVAVQVENKEGFLLCFKCNRLHRPRF